jgi:cation-transporting ATPase 13A3/4/5
MTISVCSAFPVPGDFEKELEYYTREGYRVLGVAFKNLPPKLSYPKMQRLSREEAETALTFLGLVVMENRLKPQTSGVLRMLTDANIRTVMVTGKIFIQYSPFISYFQLYVLLPYYLYY